MQRLYTKDGKIYDIRMGVDTGEGTTLYNGTESEMRALGYEPYIPPVYEPSPESILEDEMRTLQEQLSATDYILFKSLEGYDCDTEYPDWRENRRMLREQYNEKEAELKILQEQIQE